jgi:ATP-dependent DNA helicase DinG
MRYVILDFETTDLSPEKGEIWEIGALEMDGLIRVREFHSLVATSKPLPLSSQRLSKVSADILGDAPSLSEVIPKLLKFIDGLPIVAQNCSFERRWFQYYIENREQFYDSAEIFALVLSHLPSHSEDNLRSFFGIKNSNSHRAIEDCRDLADIMNETHKFLIHSRPEILTVFDMFLREVAWFWNWFFEGHSGTPIEKILEGQREGNLRELIRYDLENSGKKLSESNGNQVSLVFNKAASEGGMKSRPQQMKMALQTNAALEQGERIAIEAPTGTGKSFAYLVPSSLNALATKVPVVISTHTKELQNQIMTKDHPRLEKLLGSDIAMTVVKGQNNYFCLRKLFDHGEEVRQNPQAKNIQTRWPIAYLYSLALSSSNAEVPEWSWYSEAYPELATLLTNVRSHKDTTIGEHCPHYSYCRFFNNARRAHNSDVIVANHALAFSWPTSLPRIRKVVFDEAHHIENEITQAFTVQISLSEIRECFSSMISVKKGQSKGLLIRLHALAVDAKAPAESLERLWTETLSFHEFSQTFEELSLEISKLIEFQEVGKYGFNLDVGTVSSRPFWEQTKEFTIRLKEFNDYFTKAFEWVRSMSVSSRTISEIAAELFRLGRFTSVLIAVTEPARTNRFNAFDFNSEGSWVLSSTPIQIKDLADEHFGRFESVVMTSATLSIPGKPGFVANELGLRLTRPPVSLPSEYKLNEHAQIFFPMGLGVEKPGLPEHVAALIDFTESVVRTVGGRTLLLMCSADRKNKVVQELRSRLEPHGIAVVEKPEQLREKPSQTLLVGLDKLGEGLDIPGQDLSCVIVEKINERMTMSPLAKKRAEDPKTNGGSGFIYSFSRRLIWLKQRVGRLVRTEADRGWIVVFDPRFEGYKQSVRNFIRDGLSPIPISVLPVNLILQEIAKTRDDIVKEEVG